MYRYDEFDEALVRERAAQFRDQVARRLDGSLSEDEFRPLRLMNGLYLQIHAYMLRVAIPYGTLNGRQLRQLGYIADRFDKGYGHLTTRQNIQYNWPKLIEAPDILDALADVEMHAIQTSGNCIRNVTADHFAGVAAEEVAEPLHPRTGRAHAAPGLAGPDGEAVDPQAGCAQPLDLDHCPASCRTSWPWGQLGVWIGSPRPASTSRLRSSSSRLTRAGSARA